MYSVIPPWFAGSFKPVSGRRWPRPCQNAFQAAWRTSSVPVGSIPILDRSEFGRDASTRFCITIPSGRPSAALKKSPLTPATVAVAEASRSIPVKRWRPAIAPSESLGRSAHSPPGRGATSTWTITAPCGVKRSLRV